MEQVDKSFKTLTGIAGKDALRHPLAATSAVGLSTASAKAQNAGAKRITGKAGKKFKAIPQITKPAKQASVGTGRGVNLGMQAVDVADVPVKAMNQLSNPSSGTRQIASLAGNYAASRGWIGKADSYRMNQIKDEMDAIKKELNNPRISHAKKQRLMTKLRSLTVQYNSAKEVPYPHFKKPMKFGGKRAAALAAISVGAGAAGYGFNRYKKEHKLKEPWGKK